MSSTSEWTPTPSPPSQPASTSARPSSSPESSPLAPKSKSTPKEHRKGKWSDEEAAEVLFIGDRYLKSTSQTSAGRVEDWEGLRDKFKTHAKGRSVNALRGKYLALIKKREREKGKVVEGGSPEHDDDIVIVEPSRASGSQQAPPQPPFSPRSQYIIECGTAAALTYVAGNHADPFQLVNPSAPAPWTVAEDAALLATIATLPPGPMRWPNAYAIARKTYEQSEQRQFVRTQEEVQVRWDSRWSKQAFWPNVPRALAAPINLITQQLGQGILQFLATSDVTFARNIVESLGGVAFMPVKPAVSPPQTSQTHVQAGPSHSQAQPGQTSFRRPSVSLLPAPSFSVCLQGLAASPLPVAAAQPFSSRPHEGTNSSTEAQRPASTGTLPQQLSSPPASASHWTPGRAAPPFPYRPSPTLASTTISSPRRAPVSSSDGHMAVRGETEGSGCVPPASQGLVTDSERAAFGAGQASGQATRRAHCSKDEEGREPAPKRTRTS